MTDKFESFAKALEALCREHEVVLDVEVRDLTSGLIRVFDKDAGETYLTGALSLADCTNNFPFDGAHNTQDKT